MGSVMVLLLKCKKCTKSRGGGGPVGEGLAGQGVCEPRIEVIVKMQKSRGVRVRSEGECVGRRGSGLDVNQELELL